MWTKKELQKRGLETKYESILYPLGLPGCCALLHIIKNANPESWWELVIAAAVFCALFCVLLWWVVPDLRSKPLDLTAAALLIAFMQAGNIWQANVLLDLKEPEYCQVEVLETDKSHSSKGGNSYYFLTELEGEEYSFNVTASQWHDLRAGDSVTIAVHSGGLGMEYYVLEEP